jgi:hypothetical protein
MSKNDSNNQKINTQYDFPCLDLIFELTKDRISNQLERVNALDSKANFVLGSATALVGAALVLQAVLLSTQLE